MLLTKYTITILTVGILSYLTLIAILKKSLTAGFFFFSLLEKQ